MSDRDSLKDEEMSLEEEVEAKLVDNTDDNGEISRDNFFHILSNSRRRTVLRYMKLRDGQAPFTTGELAEAVAAYEQDIVPSQLTSKQRKRVYVGVYQAHLPDMDKYGAIDYDDDLGRIEFPDEDERHIFDGLVALLEDEVYPESQMMDEQSFEEFLTKYGETEEEEEKEPYLLKLWNKFPF